MGDGGGGFGGFGGYSVPGPNYPNPSPGYNPNGFQNRQPFMQGPQQFSQMQQQQPQRPNQTTYPDPDEVFKVNQAPPSYEEVQNRKA